MDETANIPATPAAPAQPPANGAIADMLRALRERLIPSSWSDVNAGGAQLGRGFNTGIQPVVNAAMFVPNLGMMGVNKLAGTNFPTPSQKYAETFVDGVPPQTPGQQTMRAAGEALSNAMPLGAPGVRAMVSPLIRTGHDLGMAAANMRAGDVANVFRRISGWGTPNPELAAKALGAGVRAESARQSQQQTP
jgi:hypothetical protein